MKSIGRSSKVSESPLDDPCPTSAIPALKQCNIVPNAARILWRSVTNAWNTLSTSPMPPKLENIIKMIRLVNGQKNQAYMRLICRRFCFFQ